MERDNFSRLLRDFDSFRSKTISSLDSMREEIIRLQRGSSMSQRRPEPKEQYDPRHENKLQYNTRGYESLPSDKSKEEKLNMIKKLIKRSREQQKKNRRDTSSSEESSSSSSSESSSDSD
jgi:hypothetical protein